MKLLYTLLILLFIAGSTYAQEDADGCPVVQPGEDWLDPLNDWIYNDDDIKQNPNICNTPPIVMNKYNYAKSNCTSWAYYRTNYKGVGDAKAWALGMPECDEVKFGRTCWSTTPAVGTIMVWEAGMSDAHEAGHVAVVECMDYSVQTSWVKVSEYNWRPTCGFNYRKVTDISSTNYRYIYPDGKPVQLTSDCSFSPKVDSAIVRASNEEGTSATVSVTMRGSRCESVFHVLARTINGVEDRRIPFFKITSPYLDNLDGVPPCSQISYVLEKYSQPTALEPVSKWLESSAPRPAINLPTPLNFNATLKEGSLGTINFTWNPSCVVPNTLYEIECECGQADGRFKDKVPGNSYPRKMYLNTQYNCRIRANNDGDVSQWSAYKSFITKGDGPQKIPTPAPPVFAAGGSCNTKKVSWATIDSELPDDYTYELNIYKGASTTPTLVPAIAGYEHTRTFAEDGEYGFSVRAVHKTDPSQASAWSSISKLTINCIAEVPEIRTGTADACTGVTITWDFATGATPIKLTRFKIYRKEGTTGAYLLTGEVFASVKSFTDQTVINNTLVYYKVSAVYQDLGESTFSREHGPIAAKAPPISPANFIASAEGPTIHLSFIDNSVGETGFIIERSPNNQEAYAVIKTITSASSATIGKFYTYDDISKLNLNYKYFYRARAVAGACTTPVGRVLSMETIPLAAPINLKAEPFENGAKVRLRWRGQSAPANKFEIFRKLIIQPNWDTKPYEVLTLFGEGNIEMYWSDEIASFDVYQYKVRARYDYQGVSNFSVMVGPVSYAFETACVDASTIATPTVVSAKSVGKYGTFYWTDASTNENGFSIEYSLDNATWNTWRNLPSVISGTVGEALSTSFDLSAFLNKRVFFRVRAYRYSTEGAKCYSAYSPKADVYILAPPTSVLVGQDGTAQSFRITWTRNTTLATHYEVQYRSGSGDWQAATEVLYTSTSPTVMSGVHKNVELDTDHYYRVRATRKSNSLILSASDWLTSDIPVKLYKPAKPSQLQVSPVDPKLTNSGTLKLTWMDNADNETDHYIFIRQANAATFEYENNNIIYRAYSSASTAVTKVEKGSRTYTPAVFNPGKYKFGILARNSLGNSDTIYVEHMVYGTPVAPTMSPFQLECSPTERKVVLYWVDNSKNAYTETEFRVYRKLTTEPTSAYILLHTSKTDETTWTDNTGMVGKSYHYVLRAYSSYTNAETSSTAATVTLFGKPVGVPVVKATFICKKLNLSWNAIPGADGYLVKIECENEVYPIQTTAGISLSFVTTKTGYHKVTVQSRKTCVLGDESQPISTWVDSGPPPVPTSVNITVNCAAVSGTWNPVDHATYKVQVYTKSNVFVTALAPVTPSFAIPKLNPGDYVIKVNSVNLCGSSALVEKAIKVLAIPAKPVISTITPTCTGVILSWAPVAYAEYYNVYEVEGTAPTFRPLGKVYCNSIERTITGSLNTTYAYVVAAGNSCGVSALSLSQSTVVACPAARIGITQGETVEYSLKNGEPFLTIQPNPFTASALLKYTVNSPNIVNLTIYNQWGQPVLTLVKEEYKEAGSYEALIQERYLASGLYIGIYKVGRRIYTTRLIKQ